MRCLCCNKELTDSESKKKYSNGEFMDACHTCRALGHHKFGYSDLFDGRMGDEVGELLTKAMSQEN